jgi:hypothetical protein
MSSIALLEYAFMFDTGEAWSNLYQFESTILKYFETLGFEAEILKTVEGATGRRILMLKKKSLVVPQDKNSVGRPQTAGGKLKELGARKLSKVALAFKKKK